MTGRAATMENVAYSESIQDQYILNNITKGVQKRYVADDILTMLKSKTDEVMAEQCLTKKI